MGSSIFNQAAEFLRENKTAKRALGIMVCLALLVALGTVGVLTSTGQAMTQKVKTLDCSFAVHQHTNDCYDGAGNLVCGRANYVVHVHNDDCRNEAGEIVCDLPEIWPHTHSDECWQDVTELVCGQAEDLGHTHSDACYSYEQGELTCVKEEHTHDETCYVPATVLTCEVPEHTHSEACYDPETGELTCGLEEHVHDGALCYTQGQELACGKEEHTHTDACYKQNATLTCGLEERPAGHVHTDECYKTEHVLVCDKLENHEHTEDCYDHDEAGNRLDLICGKIELLEHTHDESCFKIEEVPVVEQSEPSEAPAYVCGLEEHTHSDACYDAESGELICGLEEHVHDASCLPAVALPEASEAPVYVCGLEEHTHSEACYDENNELTCGLEEHTHSDACLAAPEQETYCGLVEHTHSDACLNEAGEIVCGLEEHTHDESCFVKPVVYYCGLEEHTHDESCYDEAGELICGLEEHTHTDACLEQIIIQTVETEGLRVTAAYGPEANIPETAEFRAERILPEGETEQHYAQRVAEAGRIFDEEIASSEEEIMVPRALLNVGFYLEDGTEVPPAAPVTVTVQFLDESGIETGEKLTVIHFADAGTEALETTALDNQQATTFTTDSFSEVMVIGTTNIMTSSELAYGQYGPSYSGEYVFEHKKQIDYLGDNASKNQENPDTSVDNTTTVTDDLYRLYLDMEGKSEPVDLLLVVDRSGSMKSASTDRDGQLDEILFGTDHKSGLVGEFLAPNKNITDPKLRNYVAMVYYGGYYSSTYLNSANEGKWTYYVSDEPRSPSNPSEGGESFGWTSTYPNVSSSTVEGNFGKPTASQDKTNGVTITTNYMAGYYQADQMLDQATDNQKGHKKVVIFISDGLPTEFYTKSDFSSWWSNNSISIKRYGLGTDGRVYNDFGANPDTGVLEEARTGKHYIGGSDHALIYDYGNNSTKYAGKKTYVGGTAGFMASALTSADDSPYIHESKACFDIFANSNKNILLFTIGIDMGSDQDGFSRTPVLEYMAERYGTNMISVDTSKSDALDDALRQVIFPASVSISDTLSANVDLYKTQPDIKVTATPKAGGDAVELWSYMGNPVNASGAIAGNTTDKKINGTSASQIIKEVTYDIDSKTIEVVFNPTYSLDPEYTFTLSFNVKLTDQAYNSFAVSGTGYNGNKGASGSDYGSNNTSSEKNGLNSNESANVHYKVGSKTYAEPYEHPVVQAWRSRFAFKKTDDAEGTNGLANVPFMLKKDGQAYRDVANLTTAPGMDGWYLTGFDGTIDFGYLPVGHYELIEKVPEKYTDGGQEKTWVSFDVVKGRIVNVQIADKDNAKWNGDADGVWNKTVEEFLSKVNSDTNKSYYEGVLALTIENPVAHPDFEIYKVGETADVKLEDAKFELSVKQGDSFNTVGELTSDENGLLFKNNETKVGGLEKLESGTYRLVETQAPNNYWKFPEGFAIYFKVDGTGITLTDENGSEKKYEEAEVTGALNNELKLTISNEKVKSKAELIKVDVAKPTEGLPGAQFALYEGPSGSNDPSERTLVWKGTSHDGGKFTNDKLDDGTAPDFPFLYAEKEYYLVETVVPAGYNVLPGEIKLTVAQDGTVAATLIVDGRPESGMVKAVGATAEDGTTTYTITIMNSSGYQMPRTGGEGVTLYLLGGAVLVTFAGTMLLLKRRKKNAA